MKTPAWRVFAYEAQKNLRKNWSKASVIFDIRAFAKDRVTKEFHPITFELKEYLPDRKEPVNGSGEAGNWLYFQVGECFYCGGSWLNENWYNGRGFEIGPFKCQYKNLIKREYNDATDTSTVKFNIPRFFYCGYYEKGKYISSYYLEGTITVNIPSNILIPVHIEQTIEEGK